MRKILFLTIIIIVIPYIITIILTTENEIKFDYKESLIVRVKRNDNIEEIYLEDYITGVLAGELPITFDEEAFKAQAVAARSYVLKKIEYNKNNEFDVYDSIKDQVYLDKEYLKKVWKNEYIKKINKLKKIVIDTSGEYLTYEGKIIDAFFFSTSVGYTENSEDVFQKKVPYLRSVKSTWDKDTSPVFYDQKTFTLNDFYQKLNLPFSKTIKLDILETTSTNRINKLKINNEIVNGVDFRFNLGLRSNYFDLTQDNDKITIKTQGYGHGVGMSQYGAQAMAKLGYNYEEILKHYYTDVVLKKI